MDAHTHTHTPTHTTHVTHTDTLTHITQGRAHKQEDTLEEMLDMHVPTGGHACATPTLLVGHESV